MLFLLIIIILLTWVYIMVGGYDYDDSNKLFGKGEEIL